MNQKILENIQKDEEFLNLCRTIAGIKPENIQFNFDALKSKHILPDHWPVYLPDLRGEV